MYKDTQIGLCKGKMNGLYGQYLQNCLSMGGKQDPNNYFNEYQQASLDSWGNKITISGNMYNIKMSSLGEDRIISEDDIVLNFNISSLPIKMYKMDLDKAANKSSQPNP